MADPQTELDTEQIRLADYLAAERKALKAQRYQVGDGSVARSKEAARLAEIQAGIRECRARIAALQQQLQPGRRVVYLRSGW